MSHRGARLCFCLSEGVLKGCSDRRGQLYFCLLVLLSVDLLAALPKQRRELNTTESFAQVEFNVFDRVANVLIWFI